MSEEASSLIAPLTSPEDSFVATYVLILGCDVLGLATSVLSGLDSNKTNLWLICVASERFFPEPPRLGALRHRFGKLRSHSQLVLSFLERTSSRSAVIVSKFLL